MVWIGFCGSENADQEQSERGKPPPFFFLFFPFKTGGTRMGTLESYFDVAGGGTGYPGWFLGPTLYECRRTSFIMSTSRSCVGEEIMCYEVWISTTLPKGFGFFFWGGIIVAWEWSSSRPRRVHARGFPPSCFPFFFFGNQTLTGF